jgi:hypothetical protein
MSRKTLVSAIFRHILTVVLDFVTLQDKRNISTLLVNIQCIRTRCETKPCTNKYYIFYQYPYIVHSFNLIQAFTTKINRQSKICNLQESKYAEPFDIVMVIVRMPDASA